MEAIVTILILICIILNMYVMILDRFYPKQVRKQLPVLFCFLISQWRCDLDSVKEALDETPVKKEAQDNIRDVRIYRDELTLAMEKVGQSPTEERDQSIKHCMGYQEFSALFQDSEPSLDEVKEAFSVFDQNRDGLVDAGDLKRVLGSLGLSTGTNLDACEWMIAQHDRNGDGYVDLIDFSRLLEMCLLEKVD